MLTITDIIEQREQAQQDVLCVLDGIDNQDILDNVCQVIVDRFNILLNKINIQ